MGCLSWVFGLIPNTQAKTLKTTFFFVKNPKIKQSEVLDLFVKKELLIFNALNRRTNGQSLRKEASRPIRIVNKIITAIIFRNKASLMSLPIKLPMRIPTIIQGTIFQK